ncbi:efflux transporter outer membrane subunit [Pseudoxanthomonas wuyuanensis]|uniref:Outer membrane protein, multidrug efflux system n=1 Tax=Pseudoxanthomonas wuyuanensis TaxID=1073196 RepID=A0A286D803_9GAMM|nr:efflux transporter outer membrane subunit [Pseudoxanthomonas wuyuanensis]KAF1720177.1 RND transporter [Pseudoxanthomonas wuyuanensis]SOD54754.1 outer membrane protein, multidrug efflux system [Pseudoxanthomonas wuyuanensis]
MKLQNLTTPGGTQRVTRPILAIMCALFVSACSLAPKENRPNFEIPSSYGQTSNLTQPVLDASDEVGVWKSAEPAEQTHASPWWNLFEDPTLVRLQEEALAANPDVSIAMARIKQARALTSRSEAARLPEISTGFGPTRQRTSGAAAGQGDGAPGSTQTLWRAQTSIAYEVDLFGRVASGVAAARADSEQQTALAHQMLLVVQADVARTYFSLRQLEAERELLRETVTLREAATKVQEDREQAGAVAGYLVNQTTTELLAARSELSSIEQQYALTSHALAVLVGKPPGSFSLWVDKIQHVTVQIPAGMPSTLLERRPDIAAAERAMVAENARVGVAKAAFFPSLSLTGSGGFESLELSNLANWSQRTFLLGPLVGAVLNLPIFDGGKRKTDVARARALYDERVGQYRKTVLQAFREVEDALVSIRTIDERVVYQQQAQLASSRVATSAKNRFEMGDADYLLVVDAGRTHLRSQQLLIQSEGDRARATVDLIRALGGGWDAKSTDLAAAKD